MRRLKNLAVLQRLQGATHVEHLPLERVRLLAFRREFLPLLHLQEMGKNVMPLAYLSYRSDLRGLNEPRERRLKVLEDGVRLVV